MGVGGWVREGLLHAQQCAQRSGCGACAWVLRKCAALHWGGANDGGRAGEGRKKCTAARTVTDSSKKLASPPRPRDMAPTPALMAPPAAPPTAMATCPENCSPLSAAPPRLATKSMGLAILKVRIGSEAAI